MNATANPRRGRAGQSLGSDETAYRLVDPPPDQEANVRVATAAGRAFGDETAYRLVDPPPDVEANVRIASSAALEGDASLPASLKDADYADEVGPAADPPQRMPPPDPWPLDNRAIYRIVREVALADSGTDGYAAVSADVEFNTPGHPAYQQTHFGLGFGLVLFTQRSGQLGRVLRLMRHRDAAAFRDTFGPAADELMSVTNDPSPDRRLAPVAGEPLWGPGWVARFRAAGAVPAFQAAQNEQAIEGQFRPMLAAVLALGLDTDRGLAMAYDRVVVRGLGGGLRWVVSAAGVLPTEAHRTFALDVLGFDDLASFQDSVGWGPRDGVFGPETHAALVGALRDLGGVPLPTAGELCERLVRAAGGAARGRLTRLRDSAAFTDDVFTRAG